MRLNTYFDKKRIVIFVIVAIILLSALTILRVFLGGDEDTWICEKGRWIQHGHPSLPMPTSECK